MSCMSRSMSLLLLGRFFISALITFCIRGLVLLLRAWQTFPAVIILSVFRRFTVARYLPFLLSFTFVFFLHLGHRRLYLLMFCVYVVFHSEHFGHLMTYTLCFDFISCSSMRFVIFCLMICFLFFFERRILAFCRVFATLSFVLDLALPLFPVL